MTALRPAGHGRVAVELDGARWRVVPLEAAHRVGLVEGLELDRPRLRALARELRRTKALGAALGSLRHRDHSRASLAARLARGGVAPAQREETLAALDRAGLVDDARFAEGRAASLADRAAGNLLIAEDLERHGIDPALIESALAALEPEPDRAARLVTRRGRSARTARFLAAKGFDTETVELALEGVPEAVVAETGEEAIG